MNTAESSSLDHETNRASEDQISLADIWGVIKSRRLMIAGITVLVTVIAVVISLVLPVKYQASVLLSPISDESGSGKFGGLSSLLSQYGGLSAVGGFNFAAGNRTSESIATLQSHALTDTYIREKNLLPILFPDLWDASTGKWRSTSPKGIPTPWMATEYFDQTVVNVLDDKKTGLIKLTITWKDPKIAAEWANDLVSRANRYLRQQATEQSARNIAYLNDQLTHTSVVELQRAIYELIEAEIKKVMVAQGSEEYAFKVLDPAVPPERKTQPKRKLIVLVGMISGLIGACVLALVLGKRAEKFSELS